jgi:tubulin-folding cofactor B
MWPGDPCSLFLQMSIESVKIKLSFHCGTSPSAMVLQLMDDTKKVIATLYEDDKKLGFYSPYDG